MEESSMHPSCPSWTSAARLLCLAALALAALALAARAGSALAGPTFGFVEDFAPADTTAGFVGGAQLSNPGTGGVGGAGDGFLRIARPGPLPGNLGCFNAGPDYAGDYIAAGVTNVVFWLNDVETDEPLEIHLGIGTNGNFWQYNTGFSPPENGWARFEVNLADSANFTQTISFPGGSYTLALQTADRLHWRHDLPPFIQQPDPIVGQAGLDRIFLTNAAGSAVGDGAPGAGAVIRLAAWPNPARPATRIAAALHQPAAARLRIVSVSGRVLRELFSGPLAAGTHTFPWDGRDARGAEVAAGVYFIQLDAGERTEVGRIAVVR
jgi:hypothetical protein